MSVFSYSENKKAYFLILYMVITSITIYFHEFWRDEWNVILVSIYSESIPHLISLLKLEQHPPLWYFLIKAVWSIYPHFASVKILHILIALCSAYILLYKIEYPFYHRVAFLFSYFLLYEYTIICRNYSLVILFALLAVSELQKNKKSYFILFGALAGMAFSHVNGILLSIGFCFYFILISKDSYKKPSFILFIACYLFAIICVGIILHPEENHNIIATKITLFRLVRFFIAIPAYMWNVFVPIPEFKINFWDIDLTDGDSNIINGIVKYLFKLANYNGSDETIKFTYYLVKSLIFIPLLYLLLKPLFKSYNILLSLLLFWSMLMLLQGFVYAGYMRHWGFYFISFTFFAFLSKKEIPILKYFLAINIVAGVIACVMDIIHPFSSGKNLTESLKNMPANSLILAEGSIIIPPVSGYLNQPVYIIDFKRKSFYTDWNQAYSLAEDTISPKTLFYSLEKELKKTNVQEGALILYAPDKDNETFLQHLPASTFKVSTESYEGSLSGEDFFLIKLKKY